MLNIGKDHSHAVALEEEELHLQWLMKTQQSQSKSSEGNAENQDAADEEENDGDDETYDKSAALESTKPDTMEREGKSREIIKYLISLQPTALVTENNFQATPVDTVLEKLKSTRTKNKIVQVFGLYDDPPTARLLLLAHRNRTRGFISTTTASSSGELLC